VVAPNDWKRCTWAATCCSSPPTRGDVDPISPDLTRNDKSNSCPAAADPARHERRGDVRHDPLAGRLCRRSERDLVGTDDGLVQVTSRRRPEWANSRREVPEWGRAQQIEVSPFAGHGLRRARLPRGREQQAVRLQDPRLRQELDVIASGLPADGPGARRPRGPEPQGMLVVAPTPVVHLIRRGRALDAVEGQLPTAPIYDIKFHQASRDLIVATHGRGGSSSTTSRPGGDVAECCPGVPPYSSPG